MKQDDMEKTNEAEINGKGGGQTMVEETIRTIRETERQAQKIVEDAQAERERILAEAKERSGQIRDEIIGKAKAEAKAKAEQAEEAGKKLEEEARAAIAEETEKLKISAGEKKKEAVEAVVSLLTQ
jgi:vacuolar-type H+-ATPase subunit H